MQSVMLRLCNRNSEATVLKVGLSEVLVHSAAASFFTLRNINTSTAIAYIQNYHQRSSAIWCL